MPKLVHKEWTSKNLDYAVILDKYLYIYLNHLNFGFVFTVFCPLGEQLEG